MTEHPILAMMLNDNSFLGQAEAVENEIMPLQTQLEMKPGDHAILAAASTPLERDFVMITVLDPERHEGTFPDWEERLLNSYLLCEYFSREDMAVSIGWFARVKMLPISAEHWREADGWREQEHWPNRIPDWAEQYYLEYSNQLSKVAPERVTKKAICPYCDSLNVALRVIIREEVLANAGSIQAKQSDGSYRTVYLPCSDAATQMEYTAHLQCQDCGASADLKDEEWDLPGRTS
jgi:hypothetical protein